MAIQAKYDPKQDRMLLSLEAAEGARTSYWITRRQWLGLEHGIAAFQIVPAEDRQPPQEPRKGPLKPLPPQPDAVPAESVRLRREGDGVRVMLGAGGGKGTALVLQGKSLLEFQRMLDQQAERAGWDPRAGIERLGAAVEANRAMRKAQGEP